MKRGNRIILVIIFIFVLVFGVAQFFAFPTQTPVAPSPTSSNQTSSTSTNPASAALLTTQIIQYEPSTPASSTPVEKGSCWTNSISAPFRGDAWRCSVGNGISDPCFQIPGSPNLLCGMNPANPESTSTFVLQLTQPLPKSQPVQGLQPSGQGWLVELQGGTLCSPYTGTLPFTATGEAASYGCAPGPLGGDVNIFNINSSSSIWTADIGTLATASPASTSGLPTIVSSSTVPIAVVWQ